MLKRFRTVTEIDKEIEQVQEWRREATRQMDAHALGLGTDVLIRLREERRAAIDEMRSDGRRAVVG